MNLYVHVTNRQLSWGTRIVAHPVYNGGANERSTQILTGILGVLLKYTPQIHSLIERLNKSETLA